jgi:hypothetical protein
MKELKILVKVDYKDIKEIEKIRKKYLAEARDFAVDYELFVEIFDKFIGEIIESIEVV